VIFGNSFVRDMNQTKKYMKFTFGFLNGCYWLVISTAEQLEYALENMRMTNLAIDRYLEALSNHEVIYLNQAGGYHTGRIQNTRHTQFIEKTNSKYPTKLDRVEVMKAELLVEINAIENELGLPLTKELIL
jgi:hypothetical protein